MPGVSPSLVIGLCVLAVAGARSAWSAPFARPALPRAPRIAPLEVTALPEDGRKELRAVIAGAIRQRGAEAVPWESLEELPRDCEGAGCIVALARATAASHVLRVQGGYADEGYRLKLQLWDGRSGRLLASDARECEICTLPEMYRAASERISAVATRAFEEPPRAVAAPGGTPPTPPVRAGSPPPREAGARLEGGSRRPALLQPIPLLGAAMGVGGIAIGAVGGYFLAVDGDCSPRDSLPCLRRRDTGFFGAGLLLGGLTTALVGAGLLYWGAERAAPVGVALGPRSLEISVGGSF